MDGAETLLAGLRALGAVEMPLAEDGGGVAGGLQRIGDGDVVLREPAAVGDGHEAHGVLRAAVGGLHGVNMVARRVGAGEKAGATRRAVTGGGVGVAEHHAGLREAIEIRRLVEIAALPADVLPTEIVGEDEDDVGRASGSGSVEERDAKDGSDQRDDEGGEETAHRGTVEADAHGVFLGVSCFALVVAFAGSLADFAACAARAVCTITSLTVSEFRPASG